MPIFPRYESKAQLTTQAPSVGAVADTSGQKLEQVAGVANKVADLSVKMAEARKSTQKTVASVNSADAILDIHQRALVDPDPNKIKDYQADLEKSRNKNTEGLDDLATLQINHDYNVANIQLQNLFHKKNLELDTIATKRKIDQEINNPTIASLPRIKALLNEKIKKGLIDPSAAYAEEEKANRDLGVNRINKDLYQAKTPEDVDAVTQGITSGEYEKGGVTIEPDQKKALLDIADRARTNTEKKLQAQEVEAQAKNRMETVVGLASGQIQFDGLNMKDISEYDPQLATTLTKVKDFMVNYNPKLQPNEQALSSAGLMTESQIRAMRGYARAVTDVFLQNDNEKLGEFVLRELDKKSDGLTPSIKLAAFANLAALKSKINNQQGTPDLEAANRFNSIKSAVKFLQASNPYLASQAIGDFIVKNFISGASSDKDVMQEANGVLKEKMIDRHKSLAKLSSLPNKIVDGEASVEDLHSGLDEEVTNGSYSDSE